MSLGVTAKRLSEAVVLRAEQIVNPVRISDFNWQQPAPILILLAAGKGTRFGTEPKCVQPVAGVPLARHSIDAFRRLSPEPAICLVGYRASQVAASLGDDNLYVLSSDPAGGTALAAYEAFAVGELTEANPIVVVTMGDRIVPTSLFQQLLVAHQRSVEADLTMLTAIYHPPRNQGKGRIVRDDDGLIRCIVEQRDIDALPEGLDRDQLQSQREGNCPLYAMRARTLKRYLNQVRSDNAQGQFYFTDLIESIRVDGGTIRSITVDPGDDRYELLCADVTRPDDLHRLEKLFCPATPTTDLQSIVALHPPGQLESIAAQLQELIDHAATGHSFENDQPVAIGISGGRLRIAFMHPDMSRFFGPAWQMPIGAGDPSGRDQIVVMMQPTDDGMLRLTSTQPQFNESENQIAADSACLFPGPEVADLHQYEAFGTKMAETILAELGYVTAADLALAREQGGAVPPVSRWVSNNMRRPFSLFTNAIASIRTVRERAQGERIQAGLGPSTFKGLRAISNGNIPRGGFSSSSAFTVATQNGLNALFDLQLDPEKLVELACQAEYGTGVRAGALDQATAQSGRAHQGSLISSNPRDNYRILRTFPVPADRFRVLFPYTVDRDRQAWQWSRGLYAKAAGQPRLTTSETRKMTGKSAELAAILLQMPLDEDFFPEIQGELVEHGELTTTTALHVKERLRNVPLRATQHELREALGDRENWYVDQLIQHQNLTPPLARELARTTFESLLLGWRDPLMTRSVGGLHVQEIGAPLRAMLGYLYGEVTKNSYLVHHPESWIECVTQSQRGDRCLDIDHQSLPSKRSMLRQATWEKAVQGHQLMERWLERFGAQPFDFNAGLSDDELADERPINLRRIAGTNFFRGLPLIDLAEAMLQRAFGSGAVAVRVNGAGQGDYFQVHVDTELADPAEVKSFIRIAFYQRFSLNPESEFVEPQPGGGALGIKLDRYDQLPNLIAELRQHARRRREFRSGITSQFDRRQLS